MNDTKTRVERVFSYRMIRGLVGLIALGIAVVTAIVSGEALGSISASYHTDAQDLFVGLLFIISAFLGAYKGSPHSETRNWIEYGSAKVASFTVFLVAIFPTETTKCGLPDSSCVPDYIQNIASLLYTTPATIHSLSAIVFFLMLFSIMVVFTLRAWGKKKGACRSVVYAVCCLVMLISLVFVSVSRDASLPGYGGAFWAEFFALAAFGFGWLYSGLYEWLGNRRWWLDCPGWLLAIQARYLNR